MAGSYGGLSLPAETSLPSPSCGPLRISLWPPLKFSSLDDRSHSSSFLNDITANDCVSLN